MSFLLDTCVVSEMTRPQPDEGVVNWLNATRREAKFLSVITLSEIRFGILKAGPSPKRQRLEKWYDEELRPEFEERVLDFDERAALQWAAVRAEERTLPVMDGQIAATAMANQMTLVTRNVKDFAFKGLSVFNPWRR